MNKKTKPKSKPKVVVLVVNPDGSVPSEAWKAYLEAFAVAAILVLGGVRFSF